MWNGAIGDLRKIAKTYTVGTSWRDGDVAVIDNTRVMHGRRAIGDQDRQLDIGTGRLGGQADIDIWVILNFQEFWSDSRPGLTRPLFWQAPVPDTPV